MRSMESHITTLTHLILINSEINIKILNIYKNNHFLIFGSDWDSQVDSQYDSDQGTTLNNNHTIIDRKGGRDASN